MKPEDQEKEIEMEQEPIKVYKGGAVNSVNGKTGDVVLTTSDLENDSDYQTGSEVDSAIDSAIGELNIPTKTSDLENDGEDGSSVYIEADELASVATSGSYNDLDNKPTIPTVNDATLTITQNGTSKGTFTANDADDTTIEVSDTTYTAGTGIDITNGVISAIAGGGVKTLTADDYNYPTDNPNTVALWLLDDGLYMLPGAGSTVSVTGALTGAQLSGFNRMFTNHNILYVLKHGYNFWMFKTTGSSSGPLGNYSGFYKCTINSAGNFGFDKTVQTMTFEQLYNDLTTTTAGNGALDASQGRVLKNLIDSLVITGAGAPTTSTTGTVGQLYEDTTNGKLYQCTAVSGGTYTWEEVGAGGGSITPVQNTGTSTTDVMSQDATTKMVYSEANPSTYAQGGAIYLGNLDANQVQQADPATANRGWKYFWALPSSNTSKPINNSVCILGDIPYQNVGVAIGPKVAFGCKVLGNHGVAIGSDAEAVQQSVAIGFGANASRDNTNNGGVIAIGNYADAKADRAICIGGGGSNYGVQNSASTSSVALGYKAGIGNGSNGYKNSVALGAYSEATRQGEVNVGLVKDETTGGYNNTAYRVIGGVHDGQDAHDAVTVEQLNATIDAINSATGSSIPHVGA